MVKRRNNEKAKAMRRERTIKRKRAGARSLGKPMDNRGKQIRTNKGPLIVPTTQGPVLPLHLSKALLKSINLKEYLLKEASQRILENRASDSRNKRNTKK